MKIMQMSFKLILLVFIGILLSACGGDGSSAPPPSQKYKLTLTASNVSIKYGSSASVHVSVKPEFKAVPTVFSDFQLTSSSSLLGITYAAKSCNASFLQNGCEATITNNNITGKSQTVQITGSVVENGTTVSEEKALSVILEPKSASPAEGSAKWGMNIFNRTAQTLYVFGEGRTFDANNPSTGGAKDFAIIQFVFEGGYYIGALKTYQVGVSLGSDSDSIAIPAGQSITFYIPELVSGRLYYSLGAPLNGITLAANGIPTPSPWINDTDIVNNAGKIWGWSELNYAPTFASKTGPLTGKAAAVINQSNVDQMSLPYYITSTSKSYVPANTVGYAPSLDGKLITRADVINAYKAQMATITDSEIKAQWESLIRYVPDTNNTEIARILSPNAFNGILQNESGNYLADYINGLCALYAPASNNTLNLDNTATSNTFLEGKCTDSVFTFIGVDGAQNIILSTKLFFGGGDGSVLAQMVSAAFMSGELPPVSGVNTQLTTDMIAASIHHYDAPSTLNFPDARSYYAKALTSVQNKACVLTTNLPTGGEIGDIISCGLYTYAYDDLLGNSSTMSDGDLIYESGIGIVTAPPVISIIINPES